jgi:hypothetical protein
LTSGSFPDGSVPDEPAANSSVVQTTGGLLMDGSEALMTGALKKRTQAKHLIENCSVIIMNNNNKYKQM